MTKINIKKNSAVICRNADEIDDPGMALGCQIPAKFVSSDMYDYNFSLFDDHNEYVIICFYEGKSTEWTINNFEEQLEEYMVTRDGYSFADRHRRLSKLLYVLANFVHIAGENVQSYSNLLLPEWELVCKAVGASPETRYDEMDPPRDHIDETRSAADVGEGMLTAANSPAKRRKIEACLR